MTRRQADKRKRRFFGILSDPWRKLISIGLAVLLWYWLNGQITMVVSDGQVPLLYNDTSSGNHVSIELNTSGFSIQQFVNANEGVTLTNVQIELEGPNNVVAALKKPGQLAFKVLLSENDVDEGDGRRPPSITFDQDDVHHLYNPDYDRYISKMVPRTVRIELRKNVSKSLPLSAKNVDIQISGDPATAQRLSNPVFVPATVEVYGTAEALTQIGADTKLFTMELDERALADRTEIIRQLTLAKEYQHLKVSSPNVIYRVEPKRVTYELKSVPVLLDTTGLRPEDAKKFRLKDKTIDFRIFVAARSKLDEALNDHRQLGLDVSVVPPIWATKHARFYVQLEPSDITQTTELEKRTAITLKDFDPLGIQKTFQLGPDYLPAQQFPLIKVERIKE